MDQRGTRENTLNYVVDASVIAKWVLPIECNQENAFKLKRDHVSGRVNLLAPSFLTLEVTNALWKAVKLKRLSKEDSEEALKTLGDTAIALYELDWQHSSETLEIGCELDIAIYDAAYLLLSNIMKEPLITSDTKLYEKAKGQFEVLHLKDYL